MPAENSTATPTKFPAVSTASASPSSTHSPIGSNSKFSATAPFGNRPTKKASPLQSSSKPAKRARPERKSPSIPTAPFSTKPFSATTRSLRAHSHHQQLRFRQRHVERTEGRSQHHGR